MIPCKFLEYAKRHIVFRDQGYSVSMPVHVHVHCTSVQHGMMLPLESNRQTDTRTHTNHHNPPGYVCRG